MASNALTSLNRWLGRRLPPQQTIWLKRLRRAEHPWQGKQRALRRHLSDRSRDNTVLRRGRSVHTVVERGYDAHQAVAHNQRRVMQTLDARRIEYVRLPSLSPFKPVFATRLDDLPATLDALAALPAEEGWELRLENERRRNITMTSAHRSPHHVFRIIVTRPIISPSGHLMSTPQEHVLIEPWQRLIEGEPRADGSTHAPGTLQRRIERRGPLVEYLTPQAWANAAGRGDHAVTAGHPHLYQITEPVDLVYTWVDGADPAWRARKAQASGQIDTAMLNETALSESRFANRDELMYSLRSVESYANWVNHIYIVTDRQVPKWLDTQHPKITVIDHRDIFSDPTVLPVFNSHAIETQLHHIEGLSEHYLYMNDDLFFMRPVRPEQFFTSNGLSKFFPSLAPLDTHEASSRDLPVLSAAKNGRAFMAQRHGRAVTNKFKHTPHPQLRSVMHDLENEQPQLFRSVAASRFRAPSDYSIASSLYHFHAYAERRAVPGKIAYDYVDISSADAALRLEWFSFLRRLDVICVNDTDVDAADREQVDRLLTDFLERRFAVASSFER